MVHTSFNTKQMLLQKKLLLTIQSCVLMLLLNACNNTGIVPNSYAQNKITDSTKLVIKDSVNLSSKLKFEGDINVLFEDSQGNLWIGSHNEGLCLYDGSTFTYYTIKDGLSDNQIRSIQEDKNGIIWISCIKSICSYENGKIIKWKPQNHSSQDFNNNKNWSMSASDLWFHGDNKEGVYRYDGSTITFLEFPIKSANMENPYLNTCIDYGANGKIWFGAYPGVIGYDGKSFTIINDQSLGYPPKQMHVRSILEDSKGNLWIGNNGIGVLLHDGDTTINFTQENQLENTDFQLHGVVDKPSTLARVFSINEDQWGNIWFGTADAGAWKYDGKNLTNYTTKDGLASTFVKDIYKSKNGEMWFAGNGGVSKFDGKQFSPLF